ncbi:MAG: DEAD/DEAH box helicase family protein [Nitriliruptor sp.]|uniref:BPTD_3080 family restriction endonuclease n=1 Tax=Nitriliruptor sp. TaxID=2448056 RepID=UPI0034A041F1
MGDVVIDDPILNSPFEEPGRHFRFSDDGITDEIVEERRRSGYFVPVPSARVQQPQLELETQWTQDRYRPNDFINEVRDYVARWRAAGHDGVTSTTRDLLAYWTDGDRSRPLFFAQREAVETAIFLTEIGGKEFGGTFLQNQLREWADEFNPGLLRAAFKMATGSGKTTVMGMLIAWHTLNKVANPQDRRFGDAFLVVAPGITIKDRLRVLLPTDPDNVYRDRDLVPPERMQALARARVVVTNYHAFLPRVTAQVKPLAREVLGYDDRNPFVESQAQVVRRVLRDLGSSKRNVVVLNDEAHHCYEPREAAQRPKMSREERSEATSRDKEARVWLSGLRAVDEERGVKVVYDLSATPFFLKGSGYDEGRLFPWVVSDFGLIDAIEAGLVKVPRVPVADDAMQPEGPTYRELWSRIRDDLPKQGREVTDPSGRPSLPAELEGALQSLYANYEQAFRRWEADAAAQAAGMTAPVFIVVCNNTTVSKLVYDHIAGYERQLDDGTSVWVKGELPLFSNVRDDGRLASRFNTILVDSQQLESGEGLSKDFRDVAAAEIDEFRDELRQRFPGRSVDDLDDATLLREVMNTVGKAGRLGEGIRCVVSVSMLTEGWDANTVTHILGVRAFGTQLLCEQVVGRGLRRRSYALNEHGRFDPEYAEVYGVPFSFIPASGATDAPKPPTAFTRVRALEERAALAISFPRVVGYRTELGADRLSASFSEDSRMVLSRAAVPTRTEMAGIAGAEDVHTSPLDQRRVQEVEFQLARRLVTRLSSGAVHDGWIGDPATAIDAALFPQAIDIVRRWLASHVEVKDDAFVQMLLYAELADQAAEKLERAVHRAASAEARMLPILRPYEPVGTTAVVDFDTTKATFRTREDRSHVSHVVADDSSWEHQVADALEQLDEVVSYVKNDHLGFSIPYTRDGQVRQYLPDFLARVRVDDDEITMIVEVSGGGHGAEDKRIKVATATSQWVPAVNAHGGFGRWAFVEVTDPQSAKQVIRAAIADAVGATTVDDGC